MTPFLRYEFPRERTPASVRTAETNARALAGRWLAVPAERLCVGVLEQLAGECPDCGRLGYVEGDPLPGAERLTEWLWLIAAPGRVFLDVDLDALAAARVLHARDG